MLFDMPDARSIARLPAENRRVLLVKETLNLSLQIAEASQGTEAVHKIISYILNRYPSDEIVEHVHKADGHYRVDCSTTSTREVDNRSYGEWMTFLVRFIDNIRIEKQKDIIIELIEGVLESLFERYSGSDLIGFDEFTIWLESVLNEDNGLKTSRIQLEFTLPSIGAISEIVYRLHIRGHTIYTPEDMSRICKSVGIPIGENLTPEVLTSFDVDELENYIKFYSSKNPAALLTVVVLSRQLGLLVKIKGLDTLCT